MNEYQKNELYEICAQARAISDRYGNVEYLSADLGSLVERLERFESLFDTSTGNREEH